MTIHITWLLVKGLYFVIPFVPAVCVLLLPYPRSFRYKAMIAILVGWVIIVLYTTEVYNPVGIAYATSIGVDNPWVGFDNNNNVPVIFGGWLFPLLTVFIFRYFRGLRHHSRKRPASTSHV